MLRNFSLAKKIAGGFGIVLFLLIVLAFAGRFGLTRVVEKVDSANQFQLLVDHVLKARQGEKKFILTNDPKAVSDVDNEIKLLKNQTQKILKEASSKDVKNQATEIIKKSDTYAKAFKDYVALASKKDTLMTDMNKKASLALETTGKTSDEQKAKYNLLRDESETKISSMRQRVAFSAKMHEAFLNAKGYRMVLAELGKGNISIYEQWKGYHSDLKRAAESISPLLPDDDAKKGLEKVLLKQTACMEKANAFFDNNTDDKNVALIKAVKELNLAILYFRQEMQEQLEFYLEDVQIFSGQMMELSSGVDQVAKILLNTRILEKDFINTEDDKLFEQITQNIESIDKVIAQVKENIDDEEKTKFLDGIQETVKNYLSSFKSYASLMKSQQSTKSAMELNAANIQKICLVSKDLQHTQMQSQITRSTAFITIVSIVALIWCSADFSSSWHNS